ncbi:hypothetical protein N7456_011816 [Penicillium angulare]|uniref:FAD/NAD(P)-binding domain-containing protein n=1 Tax=Penicillium angulare TaxID=116970 RepID=A0A9W9K0F7_9EURO|nr:hypothetical protein N7456_011816 [Penicillium angulare]
MTTPKCGALVVGAGPGGTAVLGGLLEQQLGKIAWVDPSFESGRVNRKYREVPRWVQSSERSFKVSGSITNSYINSNTTVKLFQTYSTVWESFRTVVENTPQPNAFTVLDKLDPNKTCRLHYAADMVRDLTDGLVKRDDVLPCRGFVTAASLIDKTPDSPKWMVRVKQDDSSDELEIEASRIVLCTGSHPTKTPLPVSGLDIETLDLDLVLKPSLLAESLPSDEPITIAVVGASHSAILALLNFVELASTSHPQLRVKWFTRHALRYAEYMDGWILRDNTGLKGHAAEFARAELEDDKLATSPAGKIITKIDCSGGPDRETAQYHAQLPDCSYFCAAVGFTKDPLPHLTKDGAPLNMEFDHETGRFHERGSDSVVPGLFGAGIAFPERVVDPYGNVELAVGFFKFMKFLKRVIPSWTGA